MAAATVITLVAGGITFTNQWYQTRNLDWKVPVATVILAGGIDVLSNLDGRAATILSLLILMGAATTQYNGKSALDAVTALAGSKKTAPPKGSTTKVANK